MAAGTALPPNANFGLSDWSWWSSLVVSATKETFGISSSYHLRLVTECPVVTKANDCLKYISLLPHTQKAV